MRRYARYTLLSALILIFASSSEAEIRSLMILHTNDTHAQTLPDDKGIGGYATISTYLKKMKSEREDVLILDAGDMITGSPISTLFQGLPIFDIYNTMPYDFAALGNHEFDYGRERLKDFLNKAKSPMLCANAFGSDGELLGDAAVAHTSVNEIDIAVVGVMTSDFKSVTNKIAQEGTIVKESVQVLQEILPNISPTADLVILLSHCGTGEDQAIASSVPGIDIIVGGHTHDRLEKPKNIDGTIIVQAGSNGQFVGRVELEVDTDQDRVISYRSNLIEMDSRIYRPDPETGKLVNDLEKKVSRIVDEPIGDNKSWKSPSEMTTLISKILKETYNTDFGYQNPGGTRAPLPEGRILKRHIWQCLPFADTTAIVTVDREQLKRYFNIIPSEDKPLYTVATNTFTSNKIIERERLEKYRLHKKLLRDVVIEYFSKQEK